MYEVVGRGAVGGRGEKIIPGSGVSTLNVGLQLAALGRWYCSKVSSALWYSPPPGIGIITKTSTLAIPFLPPNALPVPSWLLWGLYGNR